MASKMITISSHNDHLKYFKTIGTRFCTCSTKECLTLNTPAEYMLCVNVNSYGD